MVYGLLLVVILVLALTGASGASIAVLVVLFLGLLLPLRLQSLTGQVATLKKRKGDAELPSDWFDGERRVLVEEIETVRAEVRALLRSERISWRGAVSSLETDIADIRGMPSEDRLPDGTTYENGIGDVSLRLARLHPPMQSGHLILVIGPDVPQTGSLFSSLIARGDVGFQPLAGVHRVLELRSRRIPSSSQSNPGGTPRDVELAPGVGAVVELPATSSPDLRAVVEFVDPVSFRYDVERFANRLPLLLDHYERVSLVLVASRPEIETRSLALPTDDTTARPIAVQAAELQCLVELAGHVPSSVVDVERLSANPRAVLDGLFERLFPDEELEQRRLSSIRAAGMIPPQIRLVDDYRMPVETAQRVLRMSITAEQEERYDHALSLHADLLSR